MYQGSQIGTRENRIWRHSANSSRQGVGSTDLRTWKCGKSTTAVHRLVLELWRPCSMGHPDFVPWRRVCAQQRSGVPHCLKSEEVYEVSSVTRQHSGLGSPAESVSPVRRLQWGRLVSTGNPPQLRTVGRR